jgi:hypothetical protein
MGLTIRILLSAALFGMTSTEVFRVSAAEPQRVFDGGWQFVRVVDLYSGQHVPDAVVRLTDSSGRLIAHIAADSFGRAAFMGLREGDYRLAANAHGFLKPEFGGPRDAFTVTAVRPGGASVLHLVRAASLTGRVVTTSGVPLFAVDVSVVKQTTTRGRVAGSAVFANGRTDDRGQFSIGGLHPGSYIVKTAPTLLGRVADRQVGVAVTIARDQSVGRSAGAVQVRPGVRETLPDIVADLRPLVTVRGAIRREGSPAMARLALTALSGGDQIAATEWSRYDFSTTTTADGRFEFSGVPAGEYLLEGMVTASGAEFKANTVNGYVRQRIVAPEDVLEIAVDAQVMPSVTLAGVVNVEGSPRGVGGRPNRLRLVPIGSQLSLDDRSRLAEVGWNGEFVVENLLPGRYVAELVASVPTRILTHVLNGREWMAGPIEIKEDTGAWFITATTALGSVEGKLTGTQVAGRTVLAFPTQSTLWQYAPTDWVQFAEATSDMEGRFTFDTLPQGRYAIVVRPDSLIGRWTDRATLERLAASAVRIEVQTHATSSVTLAIVGR